MGTFDLDPMGSMDGPGTSMLSSRARQNRTGGLVPNTAPTPPAAQAPADVRPGKKGRVLVVDDDMVTRRLLGRWLSREEYDTVDAASGEAAIEATARMRPDVIVADVNMHGMDGFELSRRLRANPATTNIPIVLVTGLTSPSARLDGLRAGADEFLSKPVNRGELLARVQTMVRLCRYQQQLQLRAEAYGGEANPRVPTHALESSTVLVVEDDPAQASLMVKALSPFVTAVRSVGTGREARSQLATHPVDIILVDLNLPDASGIELVRWAKGLDRLPHVQVGVITGRSDLETRVRGLREGADDFMVKPVSPDELRARVGAMARNKQQLDQLADRCAEARRGSVIDGLTGLHVQTYFKRLMALELSRAQRYGYDVSVVMVDVDNFKTHNDTLGHLVGDGVLKHLALTLKSCVRETDLVARYGGDEFGLLLPYTDAPGTQIVLRRIRERLGACTFVPPGGVEPLALTLSMGGASVGPEGVDADVLLNAADKELYEVKAAGKDGYRVTSVTPDEDKLH